MAYVRVPNIDFGDSPPPNPISTVREQSGLVGVPLVMVTQPAYRSGNGYVEVPPVGGASGPAAVPVGYAG